MAAQQGNGEALYTLGRMYYSGVMVNVDYDKALYFFKKAYEKELQAAADYLAQMYFNGPECRCRLPTILALLR